MEIILTSPRGFCAGVERAVDIVLRALEKFGSPIYVRHEIVHNKQVVNDLKKKGAIFVEELDEVPEDAKVIFSAHGVEMSVYDTAKDRKLSFIDATCPLVKKVHHAVHRYSKKNYKVILVGHDGHPEVVGTMGQLEEGKVILVQNVGDVEKLVLEDTENLAYTTQTTLSIFETQDIIHALKKKFPNIIGPEKGDMCYATTNRQNAILELAKHCDLILVAGSENSSNSNRLVEMAKTYCPDAFLMPNIGALKKDIFNGKKSIGISSGASAPEYLVQELIAWIKEKFHVSNIREIEVTRERVNFPLPKELQKI